MENSSAVISVKGNAVTVPALTVEGRAIVVGRGWLRLAEIFDEPWQAEALENPQKVVTELKKQRGGGDIFTFTQKLPDSQPRFSFPFVLDNVAAIPITTYAEWWEKLPQETRKNVRKSEKRGVTVRVVEFNDDFIQAIKRIYDESPVRQGRRFWHYGKDLAAIRRENATYLERCDFIGAFFENQLIAFLKVVYVGKVGRIMQIISMNAHFDKKVPNALVAKAVETCAGRGMDYFVYGQYVYNNNNDRSLVEFKRRNGFEAVFLPKYFVPLTAKGSLAVKLKLHLGLRRLLPRRLDAALLKWRGRLYEKFLVRQKSVRQGTA